jgi:hypothetical protein
MWVEIALGNATTTIVLKSSSMRLGNEPVAQIAVPPFRREDPIAGSIRLEDTLLE